MKKFTVYFMSPYCAWEGIEAKNKKEAIAQCDVPPEYDMNEPGSFIAIEEDSK